MLPEYPDFAPLTLDSQTLIERFVGRFTPYSDFNFVSLYSWDVHDDTGVSMFGDNLIVRFPGYGDEDEAFLSFLGSSRVTETAFQLLEHAADSTRLAAGLSLVPHDVAAALHSTPELIVEDSVDHADYIFDCADFVSRPGSRHRESRWELNRFIREFSPQVEAYELKDVPVEVLESVIAIARLWHSEHLTSDGSDRERRAIERLMRFPPDGVHLVVGRIDRSVEGFVVVERSPDGTGFVHFEKANLRVRGLSDFMWREGARHLLELGCSEFNAEQDLGIPGLRHWKTKRRPTRKLEKYEVGLRP